MCFTHSKTLFQFHINFYLFNLLLPSAHKSAQIAKKLEGTIKKVSYERRDYESVDKRAYLRLCLEKLRKKEFIQQRVKERRET